MHCIIPVEQSNIFEIFMSAIPIYEASVLNLDINLMPHVQEPI